MPQLILYLLHWLIYSPAKVEMKITHKIPWDWLKYRAHIDWDSVRSDQDIKDKIFIRALFMGGYGIYLILLGHMFTAHVWKWIGV